MSATDTPCPDFTLTAAQLAPYSLRDLVVLFEALEGLNRAVFENDALFYEFSGLATIVEAEIIARPAADRHALAAKIRVSLHEDWTWDQGLIRLIADAREILEGASSDR